MICVSNNQLRLQDLSAFSEPYMALSHCWGTSNLPKTTTTNKAAFMENIEWQSLTKTFQDAVTLTRKLGYDYIWIDSLCIVQNNPQDWKTQASRMATIFVNAELVISAASSKDGSGGLFKNREPVQIIASKNTETTMTVQEYADDHRVIKLPGSEVEYIVRDAARHAQWDSNYLISKSAGRKYNPLLQRAWAFQERLLATRIVHFADHEIIWECKSGRRCECMHLDQVDGLPILERSEENTKLLFDEATSGLFDMRQYNLNVIWAKVIESYNERALTYEDDRLPALTGAIERMHRVYRDDECVSGLFIADIPRCLLWQVPNPGIRHKEYTSPTWSWASVLMPDGSPSHAAYDWHSFSASTGKFTNAIAQATIDRFRLISSGMTEGSGEGRSHSQPATLEIRGPVIKAKFIVRLREDPVVYMKSFSHLLRDTPKRNFSCHVSYCGQEMEFNPDVMIHEDPMNMKSDDEIFLFAVARSVHSEKPDNILVLKKLETESDYHTFARLPIKLEDYPLDAFVRIGSILNSDIVSLTWFDDAEKRDVYLF
jgi:Heterokaryon incompatibility protein (HET)